MQAPGVNNNIISHVEQNICQEGITELLNNVIGVQVELVGFETWETKEGQTLSIEGVLKRVSVEMRKMSPEKNQQIRDFLNMEFSDV